MKKTNNILLVLVVFLAGFLAGTGFTVWKTGELHHGQQTAGNSAPTVQEEHIDALRKRLAENPQDGVGWSRLGNLYYDNNQPQKAIDAYLKSLEYQPATPNLLTDLGVMYRRVNQPRKAIDYFDKAMAKDPGHLPSRFNKGVVLLNEFSDPRAAIAVWEEILAINPNAATGSGQKIRDIISSVKKNIPSEIDKK